MTYAVKLSTSLFERLQAHATPLVDTIETVILRAVDALDAQKAAANGSKTAPADEGPIEFKPGRHPSLSHTTPKAITLNGKEFAKGDIYWNTLMYATIREAHAQGHTLEQITSEMIVKHVQGKKEDNGYKFLEEVGISVQGQDANAAWKQAYTMATAFEMSIQVIFTWQANEKAAQPNVTGIFLVNQAD
jgi:hypothetical protein